MNRLLSDTSYMANVGNTILKSDWLLDSGTTSHICTDRDAFITYQTVKDVSVSGIDGETHVHGIGVIMILLAVDGRKFRHLLQNVFYIPDAPNCLLSVSCFNDAGGEITFRKGKCRLLDQSGKVIGTGKKVNKLYILDASTEIQSRE